MEIAACWKWMDTFVLVSVSLQPIGLDKIVCGHVEVCCFLTELCPDVWTPTAAVTVTAFIPAYATNMWVYFWMWGGIWNFLNFDTWRLLYEFQFIRGRLDTSLALKWRMCQCLGAVSGAKDLVPLNMVAEEPCKGQEWASENQARLCWCST